jgi:hypothetical protein
VKAYNFFGTVSRGEILDKEPHYFLETTVYNIEKIEGAEPELIKKWNLFYGIPLLSG